MLVPHIGRKRKGYGLVNTFINKLPVELHIPGYNFCGPGTHLEKRTNRGDVGINALDDACKEHDIAYSQSSDLLRRHDADKILADKAWERVKAKDSSIGEKSAALLITGLMKGKRKLGMGIKTKKGKTVKLKKKRIIESPKKIGGFLPLLLPILGALGALGGGAAGIAKAVNDAKASKEQLEEMRRHDIAMETQGKGLFIKPYRGKGLYIKPYKGGSIKKKTIKKNPVPKKSVDKYRFAKIYERNTKF